MKFGDQIVDADGSFFKQVTIVKPDTLIAENIKKNVEIGGITGTFAGDEVEKTTQIDYSDYTPVYTQSEFSDFAKAENLGKIVRVMYDPGIWGQGKYLKYYKCFLQSDGTYYLGLLDNDNVPTKSEYVILADEDTVLTRVTIPKHENLIPANIKKDTDINGVSGSYIGDGYEYTESSLDLENGTMELVPDTDRLFSKVIIQKPSSLISSNIKEGVSIAGILGTYKLSGLPKLNKPTNISNLNSLGSTSSNAYLYVSNPATNGNFVTECQLFSPSTEVIDGVEVTTNKLVARKAVSGSASSIYFYAEDWIVDYWPKTKTLIASFLGDKFTTSDSHTVNNLTVSYEGTAFEGICVTEMNYDVANASLSKTPTKIYWGQHLQTILTPEPGFYLPKNITVKESADLNNWDENERVTYNNQTGTIVLKYNRLDVTPYAISTSRISIKAEAPNMPWLRDFVSGAVQLDGNILSILMPDDKAERVQLSLSDKIIYTADFSVSLNKTISNRSTYNTNVFTSISGGTTTYKFQSTGSSQGYSIYRCTFTCERPTNIEITYSQYNYSTYLCGFISKLDTALTLNYTADSSSNCLFYGVQSSSTTITNQKMIVQIPAGTHFIDFKWRGYYGYTAYYFSFSVDLTPDEKTVQIDLEKISDLANPGTYNILVTAEADNYTGTDPVEIPYTSIGASVDGETLFTSGNIVDETITVGYAAVDNETLFCNIKPAIIENEVLLTEGEVSEEILTVEQAAAGEDILLYGVPKED